MNREELRTVVVFDKDSCLGDTRHRWHLVPKDGPADWEAYSMACGGDAPLRGTVALARLLYPANLIHVCSGSNDSSRQVTEQWMTRNRIPYDAIYQRPAGDKRENWQLKVDYVNFLQASGLEVVLFAEDHPDVGPRIEAETGVPVLGVNPFYPEDTARLQQVARDGLGGGL